MGTAYPRVRAPLHPGYGAWAAFMQCFEGHASFKVIEASLNRMFQSTGSKWSCFRSAVAESKASEHR